MMALQPMVDSHESEDTDTDLFDLGTKTQPNGPPGLTGPISNSNDPPALFHKVKNQKSILALVVSDSKIYAGTQGGEILTWSLETYERLSSIAAHRGSVLSLSVSQDKKYLFSSAGDAIVNIWCTKTLRRLYSIYSTYDVGDVFCVVCSSRLHTVYLGAQNTSIQWYNLSEKDSRSSPNLKLHPSQRNHRFFDSTGPGGVRSPRPVEAGEPRAQGGQELEIDKQHIVQYAHYGYVYCMLLARISFDGEPEAESLISGGGDGTIKLWALNRQANGAIEERATLDNGDDSILAMALDGTFLYTGRLGGHINVWDLDTRQLIRSVKVHSADILTISVGHGLIFSGGANGYAKEFNKRYECIRRWKAHDELILASAVSTQDNKAIYVTGGNDDCVAIWDIGDGIARDINTAKTSNEQLLESLSGLISFRTVSSRPEYTEDCRRGASYLKNVFTRFGARAEMLTTDQNRNPIVFARFKGRAATNKVGGKILFYGHYDVIAADNDKHGWNSDPFTMHGIDGYLYGRGVSDNKGPVIAALFAVADLIADQKLESDIVFLIEGEEECGSRGFETAIKRNKHLIGDIDWILLANSYWINDDFPCLTYGLRGVIQATVRVDSDRPDLHSGVDGSHLMDEALRDLVTLLGDLIGRNGHVKIPNFYSPILPITEAEEKRYGAISNILLRSNPDLGNAETLTASLKARWREPSLTIHRFKTSGPTNSTIIPSVASASLSMRLVPGQDTSQIQQSLRNYLEHRFTVLQSSNRLSLEIHQNAEPWLGDPENQIFLTLEEAILEVWGPIKSHRRKSTHATSLPVTKLNRRSVDLKPPPTTSSTLTSGTGHPAISASDIDEHNETNHMAYFSNQTSQKPLYIREGGSIAAIRFLEKEFDAPAANLPCGQASDSAHLDNERMRLLNLYKSREIFKKVFRDLPLKQN